jgi:hypothetical protein
MMTNFLLLQTLKEFSEKAIYSYNVGNCRGRVYLCPYFSLSGRKIESDGIIAGEYQIVLRRTIFSGPPA